MRPMPFPAESRRAARTRVAPATPGQMGLLNAIACWRFARRGGGGRPPRVLTTAANHRTLFRPLLRYVLRLMPYGTLPPADTELVILRVSVLCGSDYEWYQHAGLAQRAGLSAEAVARVADGADASGWDERQRALLRATDELVERRTLTDATWEALRRHLSEAETIELSLLAGAYAMIAGVLNGCGVQPDPTGPLARMPGR